MISPVNQNVLTMVVTGQKGAYFSVCCWARLLCFWLNRIANDTSYILECFANELEKTPTFCRVLALKLHILFTCFMFWLVLSVAVLQQKITFHLKVKSYDFLWWCCQTINGILDFAFKLWWVLGLRKMWCICSTNICKVTVHRDVNNGNMKQ